MTSSCTIRLQASLHPIKSVTVFKSSKAEVVRIFAVDLKEGQNKVFISGLPSTFEPDSVRLSGLSADARLFDVVASIKPPLPDSDGHSETIRKLRREVEVLESQKAARQVEGQLLVKYAQSLTAEHIDPVKLNGFLDGFQGREYKRIQVTLELEEKIVQLQHQIAQELQKTVAKKGTANGRVDIVIVSDVEKTVDLKLTYIVSYATWTPTYELHASTEEKNGGMPSSSVSLHYRASVTQSTGEDWTDAALTLSTVASDTLVRQVPRLRKVTLVQPSSTSSSPPWFPNQRQRGQQPNVGPAIFVDNGVGPAAGQTKNNGLFWPSSTQAAAPAFGQSQLQPIHSTFGGGGGGGTAQPPPPVSTFFPPPPSLFGAAAPPTTAPFGSQSQQQPSSPFGTSTNAFGSPTRQQSLFGMTQTTAPPVGVGGFFGGLGSTFGASSTSTAAGPTWDGTAAGKVSGLRHHAAAEEFEEIEGPGLSTPDPNTTTVVLETPMAISFTVQGKSTIPSDGDNHQVAIAVLPFVAKISYVAIPRIDPRVFLQCSVKNTSEYRLLPGPVTVILDDSYVSKTSITDVNVDDTFTCTLGSDASSKMTYSRTSKTVKSAGGSFSEVTNTTTYTSVISVHNKHQFPIADLIVRDIIPTCEDKRVKVVLRKPAGLADAKEGKWVGVAGKEGLKVGWESLVDGKGGEREGKFEWRWRVGCGEKVTLAAEWEVSVPGEVAWVESI